jgi:hypothetical protein
MIVQVNIVRFFQTIIHTTCNIVLVYYTYNGLPPVMVLQVMGVEAFAGLKQV